MSTVNAILAAIWAFFAGFGGGPSMPAHDANTQRPDHAVVLSRDDIAHLGIQTIAASQWRYTPRVHGYGVVVDLSALAQSNADVATAAAAAHQSRADYERAKALFDRNIGSGAISRQALDAAEKQAATDAAALALAERKETAQFGQQAPWRGKDDSALLADLYKGRTVLVEATFPLGVLPGPHPAELSVVHLNHAPDETGWKSVRVWSAPQDPTIPGRSFYALIAGSDLEQGEHVIVYAPTGPAISGVRVPADAVVLSEEKSWCYVQTFPGTFLRLPLDMSRPMSGGYFVARGIASGEPVVVKGTGLLLARELGTAPSDED